MRTSAAQGTVTLNGRTVPIVPNGWGNSSITINPSGAQFDAQQPWNWGPMCTTLVIRTTAGQQVTQAMTVAPAISGLIYGQCTYWVAYERHTMGLSPFASPYNNANPIGSNWVPQRGDQLVWHVQSTGGNHTAVITSVSKTVTSNQTVYSLTLSQMNEDCRNSVTTFVTTFVVTKQVGNGSLVASALPKFSNNSAGPTVMIAETVETACFAETPGQGAGAEAAHGHGEVAANLSA